MRVMPICIALWGGLFLSQLAAAQAATEIKENMKVTTSDGKRIGRVYELQRAADGSVSMISVVVDNNIVRIPATTLTTGKKGLVTSWTRADVRKHN